MGDFAKIKMRWLKPGEAIDKGMIFEFDEQESIFTVPPNVYVCCFCSGYTAKKKFTLGLSFPTDRILTQLPSQFHEVGKAEGGYLRMVYTFAGPRSGLPVRAGLTVHSAQGSWSSWPPHAFERQALMNPGPVDFVEKFAYLTWPPGGWGVQVRKGTFPEQNITAGSHMSVYPHASGGLVDEITLIKDRDILPIPAGSHPVVAGPGYRLAYFWCYTARYNPPEKFTEEAAPSPQGEGC